MDKVIYSQCVGLFSLVNPVLFISADVQAPDTTSVTNEHKKMSLASAVPELVEIDAYPDGLVFVFTMNLEILIFPY